MKSRINLTDTNQCDDQIDIASKFYSYELDIPSGDFDERGAYDRVWDKVERLNNQIEMIKMDYDECGGELSESAQQRIEKLEKRIENIQKNFLRSRKISFR